MGYREPGDTDEPGADRAAQAEEGEGFAGGPGVVMTKSQAQGSSGGAVLGAIAGVILGAIIGALFFSGEGRGMVIAMVAFAVAGAVAGGVIGGITRPAKKLDRGEADR
ncbi:MAG: hypothetical protein M3345_08230 [Actinomycetota bacterium]|nr:hypothetical protein [Actinomycetota bacterium]